MNLVLAFVGMAGVLPLVACAQSADWQQVVWREPQVRYLLADMFLGGSPQFYRRVAEEAHEMGCLEAVTRWEAGVRITNFDQFERKKVDGKTLITRKGSNQRISGMDVKLTTD
jgi:hypothetical protein